MVRSIVLAISLRPGMVVYHTPGELIIPEVVATQAITNFKKDKQTLLLLSVDKDGIMVTRISSFGGTKLLKEVKNISEEAKIWFIPIHPAKEEFKHEPITWASYLGEINDSESWVYAHSEMRLKEPQVCVPNILVLLRPQG